jgi:hypothetical protein
MEYTILYGTPSILEREVMYHIKRGFEPLGGVSNFNQTLAQAMVKKPPNNTVADVCAYCSSELVYITNDQYVCKNCYKFQHAQR